MTETERAWTSYIILGDYEYVSLQEAEACAALVGKLAEALKHAAWMNKWQFDEHRTGGYGDLKPDAFCRCDWCKTYRDTRYEDSDPLAEAEREAGK